MKIAIAMSGGIDSSAAAALLKEEGHEVIGVTMQVIPSGDRDDAGTAARETADKLGIPHHVINFRDIFSRRIIDDFCREYRRGRTPNPCVLCNRDIKFGVLRERAREMGADYLATGHHARVERDKVSGRYLLKKGADKRKDQSYFLCRLGQEQLSRAVFPVGNITKERVKKIAEELGLSAGVRPESQEICFVPDDDYAGFLESLVPEAAVPGPILDGAGKIVGEHKGIIHYTVGQRKGLGIAAGEPMYVIAIDAERNAVVTGTKEQTYSTELVAGDLNWIAVSPPEAPVKVETKIRYGHAGAEALVTPDDNAEYHVKFTEPQAAITPGQTVVFYDGDTVLGGGTILRQGR